MSYVYTYDLILYDICIWSPRFSRFSSFINGDNDEKGANGSSMVIYLIYYYI